MRYLALGLLLAATSAWSQVEIEQPWMRASAPGQKIAAGYLTVRNKAAQPDRLVGASSPMAAKVQTHVTVKDGEVLRMREVKGYEIPAKGTFELKPGGAHLMLVDIKQALKEGDKVPVTLKFEKSRDVTVEFLVSGLAGPPGQHHNH
jgi:periplasmic copper chaperone A